MIRHKTVVESERYRVVCLACPWFIVRIGMDKHDLREIGRGHERFARDEHPDDLPGGDQ